MKSSPTHTVDRRLIQICRMYYEQRLSKSEIARQQKLSVTHVSRLLKDGQRLGVVEISVRSPRLRYLEAELLHQFGLREVRIVSSGSDSAGTLLEIARQGAALFDQLVGDGRTLGIGSGKTMFELASHVSEKPRDIEIFPLNVILEQDTQILGVTANTAATIIWFRSRPKSRGRRLELFFPEATESESRQYVSRSMASESVRRMAEEIKNLDVYFVGAGERRPDSRLSTLPASFGIAGKHSSGEEMVGDIAFNAVNRKGAGVTTGVEGLIFHTDLDILRGLSQRDDKSVVLVAGGAQKAEVIEAAVRGGLCNMLVTDSDVAEYLLKDKQEGQAA
jgi:deoxyribonucleoside regulator